MSPRPATILQADIDRLLRAAKKAGAHSVEVPVGDKMAKIVLSVGNGDSGQKPPAKVDRKKWSLL